MREKRQDRLEGRDEEEARARAPGQKHLDEQASHDGRACDERRTDVERAVEEARRQLEAAHEKQSSRATHPGRRPEVIPAPAIEPRTCAIVRMIARTGVCAPMRARPSEMAGLKTLRAERTRSARRARTLSPFSVDSPARHARKDLNVDGERELWNKRGSASARQEEAAEGGRTPKERAT